MSNVEIGLLGTLVLTIVSVITALLVGFGKIQEAVKNFIIIDEDGKKRLNTMEIFKVVLQAVTTAEKTGLAGYEKKEMAIAIVEDTLKAMGVDFDVREIGTSIDTIVGIINIFTKKK